MAYRVRYELMGSEYICNLCGETGSGVAFACDPCKFDAHPACVAYPQLSAAMKAGEGSDPYSLTRRDFERVEAVEQLRCLLAFALIGEGTTVRSLAAASTANKLQVSWLYAANAPSAVAWKCSRVSCVQAAHVDDLARAEAQAVFRCEECLSNLCVTCARDLLASLPTAQARLEHACLDASPAQVEEWCACSDHGAPIDLANLEKDLTPPEQRTALLLALERKDILQATWLLQRGANVLSTDNQGRNALHYACQKGSVPLVQLILAWKPSAAALFHSINADARLAADKKLINGSSAALSSRPIMQAALDANEDIVKLLAAAGADLTGVLFAAARAGHTAIVAHLLSLRVPVDEVSESGDTPLHAACAGGHLSIAQMLLSVGQADPRIEDAYGHDALFNTCVSKLERPELVRTLLDALQQPARKGRRGHARKTVWQEPFVNQSGDDQFDTALSRLFEEGGCATHLALMLSVRPGFFAQAVAERVYPYELMAMAQAGNHRCVDVILREMARCMQANKQLVARTTVEPASSALVPAAAAAGKGTGKSTSTRFQFSELSRTELNGLLGTGSVRALLQYPHVHYAAEGGGSLGTSLPGEGGISNADMVLFALEYLGTLAGMEPTGPNERTQGQAADIHAAWNLDKDGRYGMTALHAACASKYCTRELVQMLLQRGASPLAATVSKKRAAAAGPAPGAGAGALSSQTHTPLYFVMNNAALSLESKQQIATDLSLLVARLWEVAEVASLRPGYKPTPNQKAHAKALQLFARQISAAPELVSVAWEALGNMVEWFTPEAVAAATATQLFAALRHEGQDESSQRHLLFASQISQHSIYTVLPLLARHRCLDLLQMLASHSSTSYVHVNGTLDHLSALSVAASSSYARGVEQLLRQNPSPALTNTTDVTGRAPLRIAFSAWLGRPDQARAAANAFTAAAVAAWAKLAAVPAREHDAARDLAAQNARETLETLPVATLDVLLAELQELAAQCKGERTVDLLARMPEYRAEWGSRTQFLIPSANPLCTRMCARPLSDYCKDCLAFFCPECCQVEHASVRHDVVSVDSLKAHWINLWQALEFALHPPRKATGPASAVRGQAEQEMSLQTARHHILRLLFSGQGQFDERDLLAAVRHWSFDALNFRSIDLAPSRRPPRTLLGVKRPLADQSAGADAGSEEHALLASGGEDELVLEEEEESPCYTLVPHRSLVHLATAQQDPALIDSVVSLLLQPSPKHRLLTAHKPWAHFQLLLWGPLDAQSDVARSKSSVASATPAALSIAGVRLYHHERDLSDELSSVTDGRGRAVSVSSPLVGSSASASYVGSGEQVLLYFSLPRPHVVTHFELLSPAAANGRSTSAKPLRWQLSVANDDGPQTLPACEQTSWNVVHRSAFNDLPAASRTHNKLVQSAASVLPSQPQLYSLCGRIPLLGASEHGSSTNAVKLSTSTSFRFYRFLFTATRLEWFDVSFSLPRFRRGVRYVPVTRWGTCHKALEWEEEPKEPLDEVVGLQFEPQQSSPPGVYTVRLHEDGSPTRGIFMYELERGERITDYDFAYAAKDPRCLPAQWRLYATNNAEAAASYRWTPEVDPLGQGQDAAWTLLDQRMDATFPSNQHDFSGPFLIEHKTAASSGSNGSASPGAFKYYRLDVLRPYRAVECSAVSLSNVFLRSISGDTLLPQCWHNPRGVRRWAGSNPDNLSQHNIDSMWTDGAIGVEGVSELVFVFDKPVELADYQFERYLERDENDTIYRRAYQPRSWTLEGSNDKTHWKMLSQVEDAFEEGIFPPDPPKDASEEIWAKGRMSKRIRLQRALPRPGAALHASPASSRPASRAGSRPGSARAVPRVDDSWLQRLSNDGVYRPDGHVVQPSLAGFDREQQSLASAAAAAAARTANKGQAIVPAVSTSAEQAFGWTFEAAAAAVAAASPALVRCVRLLFAPDTCGLTPRDYALTLPVHQKLRVWERALHLSARGIDAIVVYHQPQLIDADVLEQAMRAVGRKAINAITCHTAEDEEPVSAVSTLRKMRQLARELETVGLSAGVFSTASSVAHELAGPGERVAVNDRDATSILLVTASYSRLLLECSSRALQDDPQFAAHRALASDMCAPLDMQRSECSKRVPFTTAQRQALVMRILSGLGTDLAVLASIQHFLRDAEAAAAGTNQIPTHDGAAAKALGAAAATGVDGEVVVAAELLEDDEDEEDEVIVVERAGGTVMLLTAQAVQKRLARAPYRLLYGEYRGQLHQGANSYPQRFRMMSLTPIPGDKLNLALEGSVHCDGIGSALFRGTHCPSTGVVSMLSYEVTDGNILCPCKYEGRLMLTEDEVQQFDGTWASPTSPDFMGSLHIALDATTVQAASAVVAAAAAAEANGAASSEAVAAPASPSAVDGSDAASPGDDDSKRVVVRAVPSESKQDDEQSQQIVVRIHPPEGNLSSAAGGPASAERASSSESRRPSGLLSTPALVATDALDNLVSQGASLNVLQMVARGDVRALSLMHSAREKLYLEHAWRHWRISEEEALLNRVALQAAKDAELDPEAAVVTAKLHGETPNFPLPTAEKRGRVAPLVQPFTRDAVRFSLREGDHVITGFHSLSLLRAYAGDRVAFFFAFLTYTLLWQLILFVPGLVLTLITLIYGADNRALPWNSVLVMVWSTVLIDRWYRKSSELAYKYGTLAYEDTEACRPSFSGWTKRLTPEQLQQKKREFEQYTHARVAKLQKQIEFAAPGVSTVQTHKLIARLQKRQFDVAQVLLPNFLLSLERIVQEGETGVLTLTSRVFTERIKKPRPFCSQVARFFTCRCRRRDASDEYEDVQCFVLQRINPITDEPEDFYPWLLYGAKLFVSALVMLAWCAAVVVINLLILKLRDSFFTDPSDTSGFAPYWQSAIGVILGVCMKVLHTLYLITTDAMLSWENHRTDSAWSNAKIIKTASFSFLNSYYSLFYIALTADEKHAANELAVQLVSVMISRTATGLLFESVLPFIVFAVMKRTLDKHKPQEDSAATAATLIAPTRTAAVHDSSMLPTRARRSASISISRVAPAPDAETAIAPRMQAWPAQQTGESKEDVEMALAASPNPVRMLPSEESAADKASPPGDLVAMTPVSVPAAAAAAAPIAPSSAAAAQSLPDAPLSLSYELLTNERMKDVHHDAQLEIQRPAAPSLLDNYLEIITQIGYVTCFSAVFPAAPLLVVGSLCLIGHGLLYKYLHISQRPIQERAADIGAWTSVLTFLSFASIFSNSILIFYSSGQWRLYFGGANRELCLVSFCMVLLVIKVLLMALIPDTAGWVSTRLMAAKYRQDKQQAHELSNKQQHDAIAIEREQNRRRLSKLRAGLQQVDFTTADEVAGGGAAGKLKVQ